MSPTRGILWWYFGSAPPSPDYVSGPEYPPLPEFVPEPVYLEFMPPKNDVLPAKEQPLPAVVSPTANSPGYVPESDPEEDPEEDDDEDPEKDPTDYPTDKDDDKEEEPSGDEAGDEDEDDEEEEEEYPAPADSVPAPVHHVTGRISIRPQTLVSLPSDTEVARLLAIPTPPSSPLSPWSSPLPQIPLPPLLVSPPPRASLTYPLGYQAAMIRLRAEAPSTSHSLLLPPPIILSCTRSDATPSGTPPILPIPLPTLSPSLLLPSTDHGANRPEVCLPPQKRLCFAFSPRYEVEESSSVPATRPTRGFRADCSFIATLDRETRRDLEREVGYGITDTWDEMLEDMPGAPATDETELDEMSLMSGQLNLLQRDKCAHAHIALLMERDARLSHEAWGRSINASDLARSEVMALRTQVRDCSLASSRPRSAGITCGDTKIDEYTADTGDSTAGTVRTR
ncbi:hypothetical protein Tco_0589380 [Tanacetum coccineum]